MNSGEFLAKPSKEWSEPPYATARTEFVPSILEERWKEKLEDFGKRLVPWRKGTQCDELSDIFGECFKIALDFDALVSKHGIDSPEVLMLI